MQCTPASSQHNSHTRKPIKCKLRSNKNKCSAPHRGAGTTFIPKRYAGGKKPIKFSEADKNPKDEYAGYVNPLIECRFVSNAIFFK